MTPEEFRDALVPIRDQLDQVLGKIYWQDGMAEPFLVLRHSLENLKLARDLSHHV